MENKNPTSKTPGSPTTDSASLKLLERMKAEGIETIYDRYQAQQPQCGYGQLALCCRHCNWGPCNIDPFGKGPKKGVCGADANTFAARHFLRMTAAGTASHGDHGRFMAKFFQQIAKGEAPGYCPPRRGW